MSISKLKRSFSWAKCRTVSSQAGLNCGFTLTAGRRSTRGERRRAYGFPLASPGRLPSLLCRRSRLIKWRLSRLWMSKRREESRICLQSPENRENPSNATEEMQIMGDCLVSVLANSPGSWIIAHGESMRYRLYCCVLKGNLVGENVSSLWSRKVHYSLVPSLVVEVRNMCSVC